MCGYLPWPTESSDPPWPAKLPAPPLVPERASPWRPPVLSPCPLKPPERSPWGGGNVRPVSPCFVSPFLLCPYMVLPVSCSLLVQLVPAVFLDYVPGVSN